MLAYQKLTALHDSVRYELAMRDFDEVLTGIESLLLRAYHGKEDDNGGVLSLALVRPLPDGGYEPISGHRRLRVRGAGDGRHAGDCPRPDRRGGCYHHGGQQPAKGAHPAVGVGLCVQDENGCDETEDGSP